MDTTDLWVVAWRGRGREKSQTFQSKGEATQLVRDLLATDAEFVALARTPVRVEVRIATEEKAANAAKVRAE